MPVRALKAVRFLRPAADCKSNISVGHGLVAVPGRRAAAGFKGTVSDQMRMIKFLGPLPCLW